MQEPDNAPDGSGTGQVAAAKGAGGRSPPAGKPLIIGLLLALVMAGIMATTYISAEHGVVAHNLP